MNIRPEECEHGSVKRKCQICEDAEYIAILEDALDHIARVAGMASRPTRRLDWISARARLALKGEPYDMNKLPQYPRDRRQQAKEWAERVLEKDTPK